MNFLDNVIGVLAPGMALKRTAARIQLDAIKAYEAAKPSRTHKGKRESRGANSAVFAAGKSLREQARWLDENHDLSIGILDRLEERVIGANGMVIEPQPRSLSGELLPDLADELQRRFANWSLKPDVTGQFTRPELERLILRSALRDGDVFGQLVRGRVSKFYHPNPQGTPFSVEALEADFIPLELNEPTKRIRQGLELNGWGQVVNFHVLLEHPADQVGFRYTTKAVPRDNMLHLRFVRRLHQLRGVSLFHGIITRLGDIKDYEESERVAARISAALAFYIRRGSPDHYAPNSDNQQREIQIAPGMTFDDLAPGEDVGMIESNRPNTHLAEFRNGQLKAAAAGTRSSYSSISRDYKGSYSSQRQELVEQDESNRILQQWFVAGWSRPVYREWLKMEQFNKVDPLVLPAELDPRTLFDAVYFGPTMPWIDPKKEAEAWAAMISGNAATEAEWIRARGRNPSETKRQREGEVTFNRKHNMVTPNDPTDGNSQAAQGRGAQNNAAKPAAAEREDQSTHREDAADADGE